MYKNNSTYLRPINNNSYILKTSSKIRNHTSKSLSNSILTHRTNTHQDNGVKLPSAYYNDRRKIYLNQSRALSEKSISYQSKDITFSERKRYTQDKVEKVIETRASTQKGLRGPSTMSMPNMNRTVAKSKFDDFNAKKYAQLSSRKNNIEREKKLLTKEINEKRKQSNNTTKKWVSPFRDTDTFKAKFQGKNIISKKIVNNIGNPNPFELKVLNLDRMFRKKDGKLGNVMPLPMAKMEGATSRSNIMKTIKKKDTIHEVIEEYNKLLRICKLKKTKPRIGVRGTNFTRTPTLQQLMGIKVHQMKKKEVKVEEEQQLTEQIFKEYNQFYKKHMKQNKHLATRLFAGLKQDGSLNLASLTRFYAIFINKVAPVSEKVRFLIYFFIPFGQEKIELDVFKLILELMCQDLPSIETLTSNSQFLTKEQKSKIFLQALHRVLFADLKGFTGSGQILLNRNVLQMIFQTNEDAVDLLVKLLIKE